MEKKKKGEGNIDKGMIEKEDNDWTRMSDLSTDPAKWVFFFAV